MKVIPVESEEHWHRLRAAHVGGSEVAALFGLSPYTTRYQLWHVKAGSIPAEDVGDSEWVQAGQFIEPAIGAWASKKWGVDLRKFSGYVIHPTVTGMGCTPDFISAAGTLIVQTKNVDGLQFRREWEAEGDTITKAPMHIMLQVQHELECAGLANAWLVALVGGNRLLRMVVEARPKTAAKLCSEISAFWQSVADYRPPAPDLTADGAIISALHLDAKPDKEIDLSSNNRAHALCAEWRHGDDLEGQGKRLKEAAKSELVTLLGDACKATVGDFTVSVPFIKASAGKVITSEMVGSIVGARAAHRRFAVSTQEEGK